ASRKQRQPGVLLNPAVTKVTVASAATCGVTPFRSFSRAKGGGLMTRRTVPLAVFLLLFPLLALAQVDPGVRGGGAAAGGPLASVAANNPANILNFFNPSKDAFLEI